MGLRYERYSSADGVRVNSPSVAVELPLDRRTQLSAKYLVDAVSAASYDYARSKTHLADPARRQGACYSCHQGVDALSGATRSYTESRQQADIGLVRRVGEADTRVRYTRSQENDYLSETLALGGSVNLFKRNSTVGLGVVRMSDSSAPVWAKGASRSLYTFGADLSWTQILTPYTQAKAGLSWADAQGYLADPYAFIQLGASTTPVQAIHPGERQRVDAVAALKQAIGWESALEVDYRYYQDTWDVKAHTLELALTKAFGDWLLEPSYRWYTQTQAYFFKNFYDGPEPLLSRDLKLAASSTQMLGLSLRGRLSEDWSLDLRYSSYLRMDSLDYRLYYGDGPARAEIYQIGLTLN